MDGWMSEIPELKSAVATSFHGVLALDLLGKYSIHPVADVFLSVGSSSDDATQVDPENTLSFSVSLCLFTFFLHQPLSWPHVPEWEISEKRTRRGG